MSQLPCPFREEHLRHRHGCVLIISSLQRSPHIHHHARAQRDVCRCIAYDEAWLNERVDWKRWREIWKQYYHGISTSAASTTLAQLEWSSMLASFVDARHILAQDICARTLFPVPSARRPASKHEAANACTTGERSRRATSRLDLGILIPQSKMNLTFWIIKVCLPFHGHPSAAYAAAHQLCYDWQRWPRHAQVPPLDGSSSRL
ncbi:hypothetical protein M409DRAFT_54048 [Zasmidium cellare ATCC 36951]|uniref:Uncharacterized protein n=1 Tax=Zasmidium cellare ATCC 36951 TaxID=1080233 RepID=A0A6A6CMR9_ZASCE|nr:uncharacterized protein M409DRAFT_54048 [Zasmidium cellare ATCC 36951]KAF2167450.1 hypothetical protein M409DRAFT_54048 [Zasmidium cellare ATCC 36951]